MPPGASVIDGLRQYIPPGTTISPRWDRALSRFFPTEYSSCRGLRDKRLTSNSFPAKTPARARDGTLCRLSRGVGNGIRPQLHRRRGVGRHCCTLGCWLLCLLFRLLHGGRRFLTGAAFGARGGDSGFGSEVVITGDGSLLGGSGFTSMGGSDV